MTEGKKRKVKDITVYNGLKRSDDVSLWLVAGIKKIIQGNFHSITTEPTMVNPPSPLLSGCTKHIVAVGNKKRRRSPLSHTRALYLNARRPSPFNNR